MGAKSIAFPCISTGAWGFDPHVAARTALGTVKRWLASRDNQSKLDRVVFALYAQGEEELYTQLWPTFFRAATEKKARVVTVEGDTYQIEPMQFFSVEDAAERLGRMLGIAIDWQTLEAFLPAGLTDPTRRRSAIAATFGPRSRRTADTAFVISAPLRFVEESTPLGRARPQDSLSPPGISARPPPVGRVQVSAWRPTPGRC